MVSGRQATLRDVAALAEVSTKTVSNVIAGRIPVRPGTRDRVQRAIEELRYRPNAMARYLRLGTVHAIGLVLPNLHEAQYCRFADGVVNTATDRELMVIIHMARDTSTVDTVSSMRMSHDLARGFIVCTESANPHARARAWNVRPRVFVALGKSARSVEADEAGTTRTRSHVVADDPANAGRQAVEILADLLTPQALRT